MSPTPYEVTMYRDVSVLTDRVKDIEGHLERIAQALEEMLAVFSDMDARARKSPEVFERVSDSLETIAKVLDEDNLNVRALLLPDEQPITIRTRGDDTVSVVRTDMMGREL